MVLRQKQDITSSAQVVDKHLILSLPNAVEPIIWRMALDKIGTASFEVKPVKSSDTYKLILKPAKGAAETIAPFDNKDAAVAALMEASNALLAPTEAAAPPQGVHQQTMQQSTPINAQQAPMAAAMAPKSQTSKWLYLFIGLIIVAGLYTYMTSLIPMTDTNFGAQNGASNTATGTSTAGTSNPAAQTGVPLSADDFLNGL